MRGQAFRTRARAWGAALAAAALVAFGLAPVASAADDDIALAPPLTSQITSVSSTYLARGQGLQVAVGVTSGMSPLEEVRASASVTLEPLNSGEAIDAFLANPAAAATREVARADLVVWESGAQQPAGSLAANRTRAIPLTADPATLALPEGTNGVYGVVVTASAKGVPGQTHAFVIGWVDAPVAPLNVALVATVSGSPERAQALLAAASDSHIALLVDPTALSLIPEEDRPDLAGREMYALPAGHLDISSAVHAGTDSLLKVALQRSVEVQGEPWPWIAAPASADRAVVDMVSGLGARAVIAGPTLAQQFEEWDGPVANLVGSEGTSLPLVRSHARLSSALAGTTPDDATRSARVVAETILASLGRDAETPATVVVTPGESWIVDGTKPSEAADTLFRLPWVKPVPLTHVLSLTGRPDVVAPEEADTADDVPPADLMVIQQRVNQLIELARASGQPGVVLEGPMRDLLRAVSVMQRRDTAARAEAVAAALDGARATMESVRITSGSELTLVSNSGNVPVTVRNELGTDVTVRVAMTSLSPNLRIDDQPLVTIPAGTEQTVRVPITAIASDDVPVLVSLRSETGASLSTSSTLNVRVRAEWGNAVTGVFTAGLVVLLVAGLYRTIKRGKRDTRTGPTPTSGDTPAS